MKFTRLRLHGFKSFVEGTEVLVEPGLTGIVGPNGCGKSNLVEAIRWVMGESSYKSMRASGMDDVIFSGSANRPSRNSAEVTMSIDNSDRTAPASFNDADELEVTRRIEREAGSLYRINGKDVRARDVQLLFADASTGSRSPALVRQGQIGELINSKPTARRRLLEEAAGISGLYSRRHEAELRLKGAETNLERLADMTGQIEAQLQNLQRQARHAARYKKISEDIRKSQALLLHLKWTGVEAGVAEDEQALNAQTRMVAEKTEATAATSRERAIAANGMPELRETEAKLAAALQRVRIADEQLDREEKQARDRLGEIAALIEQSSGDVKREQAVISESRDVLVTLDAEEKDIQSTIAGSDTGKQDAADALAAAQAELDVQETRLSELLDETASIKARRNQLDRTISEQANRAERFKVQIEEIASKLKSVEEESGKNAVLQRYSAAVDAAGKAVERAEKTALDFETQLAGARDKEAALRDPWIAIEREAEQLKTEAATLAKVLNVEGSDLWPSLVDAVEVDKGYEIALGTALGDDLEASADSAAPAHWGLVANADNDPALPAGVTPLDKHVQAPDVMHRRLTQVGLVERDRGLELQQQLKPGQRLVSRKGDLWRWDGFVVSADAPSASAQRLAQRNRLGDLELEAKTAIARASMARMELDTCAANAKRLAIQEAEHRNSWREAQSVLSQAKDRLAVAERNIDQQTAQISALQEARVRLNSSLQESEGVREDAQKALADLWEIEKLDAALAALQNEVVGNRAAFAESKARFQGLANEAALRERRLEGIAREQDGWRKRSADAEAHIETLTSRDAWVREELKTLSLVPEKVAGRRKSLIDEIAKAEAVHRQAGDAVATGEAKLNEADKANRTAESSLADAREELARIEARLEAARNRRGEIANEIADQVQVRPEKLLSLAGYAADADLPELSTTDLKLEKLTAARERIGAVNLRAEDEAREVEEQISGMRAEQEDLEAAIRKLRHAIGQLNREGRERLLQAFESVNSHFQNLFQTLFAGGEAELQLTESDDPLEAGLEILARPPGKKPQTLSLLSGGEQALTALALIFAVFLTNPAPICVLDEVDAPLDDANVERFCTLIEEMAKTTETRFMIITHNAITMSRMNRLFGVTMSERGVSQLVSVDLETAERYREAV
jgi:chromosome segregation protein